MAGNELATIDDERPNLISPWHNFSFSAKNTEVQLMNDKIIIFDAIGCTEVY